MEAFLLLVLLLSTHTETCELLRFHYSQLALEIVSTDFRFDFSNVRKLDDIFLLSLCLYSSDVFEYNLTGSTSIFT